MMLSPLLIFDDRFEKKVIDSERAFFTYTMDSLVVVVASCSKQYVLLAVVLSSTAMYWCNIDYSYSLVLQYQLVLLLDYNNTLASQYYYNTYYTTMNYFYYSTIYYCSASPLVCSTSLSSTSWSIAVRQSSIKDRAIVRELAGL